MTRSTLLAWTLAFLLSACSDDSAVSGPDDTESQVETFVGKLSGGSELMALAVDVNPDGTKRVRAYFCDGEPQGDAAWFVGMVSGDAIDLSSTTGESSRLVATISSAGISGTVSILGAAPRSFTATPATHGEGIFVITVTDPGSFSGTSLSGATLVAKLEPRSTSADVACGNRVVVGFILAPDGTSRDFQFNELSACTAEELTRAGLPTAFAKPGNPGLTPGKFTAIIDWEDDGYRRVYGRAFEPGGQITTPTIAVQDLLRYRSFTNVTLTPIPDNNPAGATVSIVITTEFTFKTFSVGVDIEHTFIGDLTVSLLRNGNLVKVLSSNTGGSSQSLVTTYAITLSEIGTNQGKATWSLKVVDNAAQDVGKIRMFKLIFGS